jgi:hypothetical protein
MADQFNYTQKSQQNDTIYFAAREPEKVAGVIMQRTKSFWDLLNANYYIEKIQRSWKFYYGAFATPVGTAHQVDFTGEQGEIVRLPVNHYRNLAQHMYVMITANRPVMDARAINTDYKSLAQTYLANGILDYYMREKNLEDALKKAVEMAIVLGAGYIKMDWNATAGELYDVDEETGETNYEGEIEFTNLSPLDVVFDGTKESWNQDWYAVRTFKNRYDLMAKYPELAEKIRTLPNKTANSVFRLAIFSNDETDDVPVMELFHKRTECMPNGRYMLFLCEDIILLDTDLPYRVVPVFRIVPSEILGTPYGYTPMFDVYPIQEAINALYSTILTNQNAFGVQNLWVKGGSDIQLHNLAGAMNIITGQEKPEPLQLTATPQEVFEFLKTLEQVSETISGVNSVSRGNPEENLKSGTALALVQSMSLQFMSGLQQSYVKLIEDVGTALIQILKDYATTPKVVALIGKNNRPLLKEFTGEQINSINRVVVDMGNALSRTTAGRVQMAEQLLQMKLLESPQEYFQVLNTGRLDVAYEGESNQLLLVKKENEKLMDGGLVKALALDQHKLHIDEHASILSDPDLRDSPDQTIVENILNHIQDHVNLLRTTDPNLLMLLNQQPLPPQGQPQPGGPPPPGVPQGGSPPPQQPMPQPPPIQAQGGPPPQQGNPPHPGGRPVHAGPQGQSAGHRGQPNMAPIMNPGQPQAQQIVTSENGRTHLPGLPKPPKPFQHEPILAEQMVPPMVK